jgi:hypothetical protein
MKLEGKKAYSTAATIGWNISRNWTRFGPVNSTDYDTPQPNLIEQLPVRCRMIRVIPKLQAGITTLIDPTSDLFINQYGIAYSPESSDFSYSDIHFARVNRRRYTVLQDTQFTLESPVTQEFTTGLDDDSELIRMATVHRSPRGNPTKQMVTRHQLQASNSKPLFYNKPQDANTVNATTGHRREYIFFHFWYEAADGGGSRGSMVGPGLVPDAAVVTVHFRPESRFKEG